VQAYRGFESLPLRQQSHCQPGDIGNRTYLPKTSVTPRAERAVERLMTISATNALTLSPALCALFLTIPIPAAACLAPRRESRHFTRHFTWRTSRLASAPFDKLASGGEAPMSFTRRRFLFKSGLTIGALGSGFKSVLAQQPATDPGSDRIVLLGTRGGPFIGGYSPSPSANLLVYKGVPYVIDTGYGVTFKLVDAGLRLPLLRYIFITHHHSDHNLELGPLLYNAWAAGLRTPVDVYAPTGLYALLSAYWESNRFDIDTRIADEGRPDPRKLVAAHEFTEGLLLSRDDVRVTALQVIHPPVTESYAFKFELGDKTVVFSGDTAFFPPLAEFAKGADYLVHEVLYAPGVDALVSRRPNADKLKASILSHHTRAEDVGRIATMANVKMLVLNHFVPPDDRTLTPDVWSEAVRTTFGGKIIVGRDLLRLPL
jgi:ribonuclease BN (tRNA processing enzyme)